MTRRSTPPVPSRAELVSQEFQHATFERLRVLVFGLGQFGGGGGAARFFGRRGAHVTITDLRPEEELATSFAQLDDTPVSRLRLGQHLEEDFQEADWIVVNPAVPPGAKFLTIAQRSGARLVTEMGLFLRWCPTPWIAGISGSNGKSTTSKLCAELLESSGHKVHLGGNIGRSLLPELDTIGPEDRVVVELSSFQLERLQPDEPVPAIVALTHFAANNHLDWHGTAESYLAAKERLLATAPNETSTSRAPEPTAILPWSSPHFERWRALAASTGRRTIPFDATLVPPKGVGFEEDRLVDGVREELPLLLDLTPKSPSEDSPSTGASASFRGTASRSNLACASAVALCLGGEPSALPRVVPRFKGLPHRQESLGTWQGLHFVNDSKATTPDATLCALEAYGPKVSLLVGGRFKGDAYEELATAIRDRSHFACVFGECRFHLEAALQSAGFPAARYTVVETLEEACAAAIHHSRPGDTILLSPACASFDQFINYEARGDAFRQHATAFSARC